jgi:hypothetical protein
VSLRSLLLDKVPATVYFYLKRLCLKGKKTLLTSGIQPVSNEQNNLHTPDSIWHYQNSDNRFLRHPITTLKACSDSPRMSHMTPKLLFKYSCQSLSFPDSP